MGRTKLTTADLPEDVLTQRCVSEEQLLRARVLATLAWGDETPIRYGYDITYSSVTLYVRQTRGARHVLSYSCSTADEAFVRMQDTLLELVVQKLKRPQEEILRAIDTAIAAAKLEATT